MLVCSRFSWLMLFVCALSVRIGVVVRLGFLRMVWMSFLLFIMGIIMLVIMRVGKWVCVVVRFVWLLGVVMMWYDLVNDLLMS